MSARAATATSKDVDKGRVKPTKVERYWPGQAPGWVSEDEEEEKPLVPEPTPTLAAQVRTAIAPVVVARGDDARLKRLQAAAPSAREAALERRRRAIAEAEAEAALARRSRRKKGSDSESGSESESESEESGSESEEDEEKAGRPSSPPPAPPRGSTSADDDDGPPPPPPPPPNDDDDEAGGREDLARRATGRHAGRRAVDEVEERKLADRRARMRERALAAQREQEEATAMEGSGSEESESEYETDSESESDGDAGQHRLVRPMFIPKDGRDTVAEREKQEAMEEKQQKVSETRLAERRHETRELVKAAVRIEEGQAAAAASAHKAQIGDVVTEDDDSDADETFEAWKLRELGRIRKDRDAREAERKRQAEAERLANMTEEERARDALVLGRNRAGEQRKKMKFMQKYYHKGAFFQESGDDSRATAGGDDIYRRDFSAPTGEDRFDKTSLPEVMQVKKFGRAGQTKWKHLVAEDTTNTQDDYYSNPHNVQKSALAARSAKASGTFVKPKRGDTRT